MLIAVYEPGVENSYITPLYGMILPIRRETQTNQSINKAFKLYVHFQLVTVTWLEYSRYWVKPKTISKSWLFHRMYKTQTFPSNTRTTSLI